MSQLAMPCSIIGKLLHCAHAQALNHMHACGDLVESPLIVLLNIAM